MNGRWFAIWACVLALGACSVGVDPGVDFGSGPGNQSGAGESASDGGEASDEGAEGPVGEADGTTTGDDDAGEESETGEPACAGDPDLNADPEHCGACNHSCLGGDCAGGRCQPVVLSSGFTFPHHLSLGNNTPFSEQHVFFTSDNGLIRVHKDGGDPVTLAGGEAGWVVVDWETVYWINQTAQEIQAINVEGFDLRTVVAGLGFSAWSLTIDEGNVYWNDDGIRKSRKLGGQNILLVPEVADDIVPFHLVYGNGSLYWRTWSGELMTVTTDGFGTQTLATATNMCSVAFADGELFTLQASPTCNDQSALVRLPSVGGPSVELTSGQNNVYPMIVHDNFVYWRTSQNDTSEIRRIPVDGGEIEVIVTTPGLTIGMEADEQALYFTNSTEGSVLKVAL